MKISVSLSTSDVSFLDSLVSNGVVESRSAAVARAIRNLKDLSLADDYAAAFSEWQAQGGDIWETTAGDGISSDTY